MLTALKSLAMAALAGAVSGCVMAAPSAFQLATYAADGASYAATGKSVTDHLISEVTAKDCALMRGLKGEDICTEIEPERMADGTLVPNARIAALGVRPAESDPEFRSFAIATAAKGDGDDEILQTPDSLSQSFAPPPHEERLAQDTTAPQAPGAGSTEPSAELDLSEEEDIAPPRDFQLDDDEDEILDPNDIQELERTHAPGAAAN